MVDDTRKTKQTGGEAAESPAAKAERAESPLSEADRIAALEAEVAMLKDRVLRTLADMDNLRKRTEKEAADARQYAVTSFARDILTVADNLHRAIAAVPADARANDPALETLVDGVEVTERGLDQTLKKFGVRPIEAKGQRFDPSFHQAMYEVANSDAPAGTVVEVIQAGYAIGDRVLRPAMVAIAKGPPNGKSESPDKAPEPAKDPMG